MSENKIKPCQSCPGLLRQAAVYQENSTIFEVEPKTCVSVPKLCSLLFGGNSFEVEGDILGVERSHFVIDVYLKYFLGARAEMDCY